MAASERDKMKAGDWYTCLDPELDALRAIAAKAVFEHNTLPPDRRGDIGLQLTRLLGHAGAGARIEGQFHCPYGFNIHLGDEVLLNSGCVILDTAPVHALCSARTPRSVAPSTTGIPCNGAPGWRSAGP